MRTNIFRNSYEQPENKVTYAFFSLLEHLSIDAATQVLYASGVPRDDYRRLATEPLYGGGEANPDGSIALESSSRTLTIFFENKTRRRQLDLEQIKRHLRVRLGDSDDSRLLVITTNGNDREELDALDDRRVHFMTWHKTAELAGDLSQTVDGPKDQLLLAQFSEYLETSDEAWRARMPDLKLIEAHAQYLKLAPDHERFMEECRRLMDALRDVASKFEEITDAAPNEHWGRVGNECDLRDAPFGQWLFFGIYLHEEDHKIKFKESWQPEFAIFFDIGAPKKDRERLRKLPTLQRAIPALKNLGFEFNFPEDSCRSPWRVCYWRESMIRHATDDVSDVRKMFETQLGILFASDFYKIISGRLK